VTDIRDYFRFVCGENDSLPENAARPAYVDQLIGRENVDHISQLASRIGFLSNARKFILETRLSDAPPGSDFCVFLTRDNYRELQAKTASASLFPPQFAAQPTWRSIDSFVTWWLDAATGGSATIDGVWLEFDVDGTPSAIPVPGFFFGLLNGERDIDGILAIIEAGVLALGIDRADPRLRILELCLRRISPECEGFQIGIMSGRAQAPLRVCAVGVAPARIPQVLKDLEIGTLDSLPPGLYEELLGFSADFSSVDIDIDSVLGARVGIEIVPFVPASIKRQRQDEQFGKFIDWLTGKGWSLPIKSAIHGHPLSGFKIADGCPG